MKLWEQKDELLKLAETRLEHIARIIQESLESDMDAEGWRTSCLRAYDIAKRYLPKEDRKGYGEVERVSAEMPEEIRMQILHGRQTVEDSENGESVPPGS